MRGVRVLEFVNYAQPDSGANYLMKLRDRAPHIPASTCKRQVYIFYDDELMSSHKKFKESFSEEDVLRYCEENSESASLYKDEAAYRFLLEWLSGTKNEKQFANDRRVKGEYVRSHDSSKFSKKLHELDKHMLMDFKVIFQIKEMYMKTDLCGQGGHYIKLADKEHKGYSDLIIEHRQRFVSAIVDECIEMRREGSIPSVNNIHTKRLSRNLDQICGDFIVAVNSDNIQQDKNIINFDDDIMVLSGKPKCQSMVLNQRQVTGSEIDTPLLRPDDSQQKEGVNMERKKGFVEKLLSCCCPCLYRK